MKSIKKTTALVKEILEEVPEAREDDMLLYYRVCEKLNIYSLGRSFGYMLLSLKEEGLPSFKSVERSRRKLQRAYPHLAAGKSVKDMRKEQEEEYRKYANEVNV